MDVSGTRRLDKYELLARLAKGGMAEILLARQQDVGFSRLVVIKRILPHLAEEPELVQMFLEEAQLAALITHPNVVQIHDVGQSDGSHYIAMELIKGPTVGEINRAARRGGELLPIDVAVEIVVQVCEGLHAAHELRDEAGRPLGLVHRDVNPHNLMVTEAGVVKLVDFGIAKAQSTAMRTESGLVRGKGPYLSPEQCRGLPANRRSDVFSLGATFYELLVGAPLFERETAFMTLKAINEDPVPPPSAVRRDVPAGIDAAVLCALERDPALRFPSADEMARTLRAARERHGLGGSPRTLARHLRTACADLLARQAETIRQVVDAPPVADDAPLPSLAGFDGASSPARPASTTAPARLRARRWPVALALLVIVAAGGLGLALRLRHRGPTRPPGPPVVFGVAPVFRVEDARAEVRPLLDYLEGRLQRRFALRVPRDYESLRAGLATGRLHVAVLNHLQYLLARREAPGIEVLATQTYERSPTYRSEIIVRDNAGIRDVADLSGRRFCYVTPGSASGFIVPRHFLREHGMDPDRALRNPRYSGDHPQVMHDVIEGRCDAGAVSSGAFFRAPRQGIATSRLRILATAGRIPMDVICASPRLSPAVRRALRAELIRFRPLRDIGRRYLGLVYPVDGFQRDVPSFGLFEQAAREEGILPEAH